MGSIGKRLREFRENLHFKQEELADKLELSKQAISKIETDVNYPTAQVLIKLALDYNLNSDWLLTGRGNMFIQKNPSQEINMEKIKSEVNLMLLDYGLIDKLK